MCTYNYIGKIQYADPTLKIQKLTAKHISRQFCGLDYACVQAKVKRNIHDLVWCHLLKTYFPFQVFVIGEGIIITAGIRSLREGNVFMHVCQSVQLWGGGGGSM